MNMTTKATATGWLWLCFGLCGACEDEPVCTGGIGDSGDCDAGVDAGGDGDADADADGDADRYAAIAASYEAERVAQDVPGLAVGIIEDGELAWSQGFGVKDLESGEPITPDTLVRFLDCFWPALAVLTLVDDGEVDLDAPVVEYVPEFTIDASADLVPLITIRHLLTHTSGLQSAWGGTVIEDWPVHGEAALEDYLLSPEFASTRRLVAEPGEVWHNSGLGAALMALVVQRVSGQLYADYMRENVLDPLGMTRTTFRRAEAEADGDFSAGVGGLHNFVENVNNPWMPPSVAWTSVREMARLAQFLLHGDEAVLSQPLFEEAVSPQVPMHEWDRFQQSLVTPMSDGLCVAGACPARSDLRHQWLGGWSWGHTNGLNAVPSRDFAFVMLANKPEVDVSESDRLAMSELLDLPALEPDYPGDDHDPAIYAGRYVLDDGQRTTRVTLQDDGTLRLSSPQCLDLEPMGPGVFGCHGWALATFLFDPEGRVKYLVTGNWVATPDPGDAGGGQ